MHILYLSTYSLMSTSLKSGLISCLFKNSFHTSTSHAQKASTGIVTLSHVYCQQSKVSIRISVSITDCRVAVVADWWNRC